MHTGACEWMRMCVAYAVPHMHDCDYIATRTFFIDSAQQNAYI